MRIPKPANEWRWFLRELRPFAGLQVLSTVILLGSTLLSLVDPLLIKWLIDSGMQRRSWPVVLVAVAAFCAAYLLRMLLVVWGAMVSTRMLERLMLGVRLRLVRRLHRMDASFLDRQPVGELVRRLEQDVEQVGQVGSNLLPVLFRIIVATSVTVGIMVFLDWRLTLIVLPFMPVFMGLRMFFRARLESTSLASRETAGERSSFLNDMLASLIQVQLLGAEQFFRRRYARVNVESVRTGVARRRTEMAYFAASFSALTVVTGAVLLAGAWQVLQGHLTIGGYIAFYSYLTRLFDPLALAVETYASLKRAGASLQRIAELEEADPVVRDAPLARSIEAKDVAGVGCLDVRFAYEGGQPVLRGVSLHVEKGERLALVGRSGSGKSTLAKLLVRLYDGDSGHVRLGDADMRTIRLRSLRRAVSLVPASPVLFRGTLRENVLLGKRGILAEDLERFAEIACFNSVVAKFQNGWDHVISPGGTGLSDGERQRLGLLRALVRNAGVLVLDEATGALDPVIEAAVLARLHEHARDKTVILITHRPAAARWADRILLMQDGRLHIVGHDDEISNDSVIDGAAMYVPQGEPALVRGESGGPRLAGMKAV